MGQVALEAASRPTPIPPSLSPNPRVHWTLWCAVLAVASAIFGVHWDISWHQSIGRDTFWSPPHLAIYLSGVLAGVACGWLILSATFGAAPPETSVKIWGFRGPLGAFIASWGCFAMLASAPFDNWWHNAYGLDVKILSPPHMILGLGIGAMRFGAMVLIVGHLNRAAGRLRDSLHWIFLYVGSLWAVGVLVLLMEHTLRIYMRSALFYRLVSLLIPMVLAMVSRASGARWAATTVMAMYSAFLLALLWVLPLFSAEPKLGPVYQTVKHFIPPEFPLLLIVPALALDWLRARIGDWSKWRQAAVSGAAFLAAFVAVQWPFANFLMSPAARNGFFGAHYFGYFIEPASPYARHQFVALEPTAGAFWIGMLFALGIAILSFRGGLGIGDWMRRVRR